jgi:thiosulfate/3-mercaptopyruvate sulfurtransferase
MTTFSLLPAARPPTGARFLLAGGPGMLTVSPVRRGGPVMLPLLAALLVADPKAYPRPDLLAEPADLKPGHKFVVLDVRRKDVYDAGHIPGALRLDLAAWEKAFGDGKDVERWQKLIGEAGVDVGSHVVVYDDNLSKDAARVWWIFRYWGVRDVRVLNGGWKGWLAARGAEETKEVVPAVTKPTLAPQPARLARKDDLLAELKGRPPQIVDARSAEEYCGDAGSAKKLGAIPGAKHLEWTDLLDKKSGRFKSAEELAKVFAAAGIDPQRPATTYCQSGGRASVMAFGLELMGGREVRNYYRSWAEWGDAADTPVEKPKKK